MEKKKYNIPLMGPFLLKKIYILNGTYVQTTADEMQVLLSKSNVTKATGPDGISNRKMSLILHHP